MKILLTGSTGLLGRRLTENLSSKGHEVVGVSRKALRNPPDTKQRWVTWEDLFSPPPHIQSLLASLDAVVHLAGESIASGRWTRRQKERLRTSRISTLSQLSKSLFLHSKKIQTIVSASGISYYGDCGDRVLTESNLPGQDFLAQLTVDWEAALWNCEPQSVRKVALRIGPVLSADGGMLTKLLPLFKKGLGSPLGDGRQYMSWIHETDIVRALEFCLTTASIKGALNAVSPHPVRNAEFTETLAHALGKKPFVRVPAFSLKLLLGEMSDLMLFSQNAKPQVLMEAGFKFEYPDFKSAIHSIVGSSL